MQESKQRIIISSVTQKCQNVLSPFDHEICWSAICAPPLPPAPTRPSRRPRYLLEPEWPCSQSAVIGCPRQTNINPQNVRFARKCFAAVSHLRAGSAEDSYSDLIPSLCDALPHASANHARSATPSVTCCKLISVSILCTVLTKE